MTPQELDYSVPTRRRRFVAWAVFTFLGIGSILGAIEAILFREEGALASLDTLSISGQTVCQRRPLHVSPLRNGRNYRHFDNILLIVFFSHARYDTNLDSYREVYSDFFPNVRFSSRSCHARRRSYVTAHYRWYSLAQLAAKTPVSTIPTTSSLTRTKPRKI